MSREGAEAEFIQNIVDKIGYDRNVPVCVVSKEKQPQNKHGLYADKPLQSRKPGNTNHGNRRIKSWFNKNKDKKGEGSGGRKYVVIYDPKKYTPGQPFPRSSRQLKYVDASFFEQHLPKYKIDRDFFESFPPKSPVEYVTTKKDQTVVRCVLIRKTHDPVPKEEKPLLTFVGETVEEPEIRDSSFNASFEEEDDEDNNKPHRTYVLVRPNGYDEYEEFSIKKPLANFE